MKERLDTGVIAGYPLRDVRVTVIDGSFHDVDSNEMAFKIAGSMAFLDACKKADPVLLEPIMKVEVVVPQEFMGDVIGNLNGRRGKIQGMKVAGGCAGHRCVGATHGNVRVCDRSSFSHAGPCHLQYGVRPIRSGSQADFRSHHCQVSGRVAELILE